MENIKDLIKLDHKLTDRIITKWNTIIPVLVSNNVVNTINIDAYLQHKYKGDMAGLFMELEVPLEHIYPHIIANGYTCSDDYDGKSSKIVILDRKVLDKYLLAITKK